MIHSPTSVAPATMVANEEPVIRETVSLEFRAELFNMFNHAQFINPSGLVPGPLGTPDVPLTNFGQVTAARDPRLAQLGLKLNF